MSKVLERFGEAEDTGQLDLADLALRAWPIHPEFDLDELSELGWAPPSLLALLSGSG